MDPTRSIRLACWIRTVGHVVAVVPASPALGGLLGDALFVGHKEEAET